MKESKYFTYEEAKEYVRTLNLNVSGLRELNEYLKNNYGTYSKKLPRLPHEFYSEGRHGGWESFTDFTGIKNKRHVAKYKVDEVNVAKRTKAIMDFKPTEETSKDFERLKMIIKDQNQAEIDRWIMELKTKIIRLVWGYFVKQNWFKKKDLDFLVAFFFDAKIDVTLAILNVKFLPEHTHKNPKSWIMNSMKRTIIFNVIRDIKNKTYNIKKKIKKQVNTDDYYEELYNSL